MSAAGGAGVMRDVATKLAAAGGICLLVLVAWALGPLAGGERLFSAYLGTVLFVAGLALGALFLLALNELTGGRWGAALLPPLHAAAGTMPWVALAFVPVLVFDRHPLLARETPMPFAEAYLDTPLLIARTAVLLVLWIAAARYLITATQRSAGQANGPRRRHVGAAAAIAIFHVVGVTILAMDWVMSWVPVWYSTAIGFVVAASQLCAALALAIVCAHRDPRLVAHHDGGNLLLAAVAFWLYLIYMEYLIIWSGNLPHEIAFYLPRDTPLWTGWLLVTLAAAFLLPCIALLSPTVKQHPAALQTTAALVLIGQWLYLQWLVQPSLAFSAVATVLAAAGVGGAWSAAFIHGLAEGTEPVPQST